MKKFVMLVGCVVLFSVSCFADETETKFIDEKLVGELNPNYLFADTFDKYLDMMEVEETLALAVKLTSKSTDAIGKGSPGTLSLGYDVIDARTPAQKLRDQADKIRGEADAMEQRDKEVQKIRDVHEKLKNINQFMKGTK